MDKQFIPVAACVATILLILYLRPAFLVNSSNDTGCPLCLKPLLVSLAVLIVGGVAYAMINDTVAPSIGVYNA